MEIEEYILNNHNRNESYTARYGWQEHFGEGTINFGYINSYKEAADILVDQRIPDLLIFPIIFNYRQYLELLLKNMYRLFVETKEYIAFVKEVSHDLSKIWIKLKSKLAKLPETHPSEQICFIEELVNLMHKLDPYSYTFRYPKDKKESKSIKNNLSINTENLKKSIDKIDNILGYSYY